MLASIKNQLCLLNEVELALRRGKLMCHIGGEDVRLSKVE